MKMQYSRNGQVFICKHDCKPRMALNMNKRLSRNFIGQARRTSEAYFPGGVRRCGSLM